MLTTVLALAFMAPQRPYMRVVYLPKAKLQLRFAAELDPVPQDEKSRLTSKGKMGWETESLWRVVTPSGELNVSYWTYAKGKKPLMTPKELATEFYSNSEMIHDKEEHARRYSDRKVVDIKVGGFPATVDLHWDQEDQQRWGILAFGDDKEQWMVEIHSDANAPGIEPAIRGLIGSVRPITKSNDDLAKDLTMMRPLPGTGFEIAAPAVLDARTPYPERGRKKLSAHWYGLDLGEEFSISVQHYAYEDKQTPDLKRDLDYLVNSFRNGARKLGKAEDIEDTVDGWSKLIRVLEYTEGSKSGAIAWVYWATPGRTVFGVIMVSDRLGGATKVRDIAKTLRPIYKPVKK